MSWNDCWLLPLVSFRWQFVTWRTVVDVMSTVKLIRQLLHPETDKESKTEGPSNKNKRINDRTRYLSIRLYGIANWPLCSIALTVINHPCAMRTHTTYGQLHRYERSIEHNSLQFRKEFSEKTEKSVQTRYRRKLTKFWVLKLFMVEM